ncbi:MAG: hypothetical protein WBX19_01735 [Terracidiphilus sp.]
MDRYLGNKAMRCARLLLIFLFAFILPASAKEPTTIAQLEQMLTAAHRQSDKDLAKQLGELELTERLSTLRLEKLQAGLPGVKSRQALLVLSDASAFHGLPAAEIPQLAPPDRETQGKILNKTMDYIRVTLPRLPNFIVSRDTARFANLKVDYIGGSVAVVEDQPYHYSNTTKETVIYRNGSEAVVASAKNSEHQRGLYNWGVFGPLLQIVVTDIFTGKMGWEHWEQGQKGTTAVFRYAVAQDRSHYDIKYCCFPSSNSWHMYEAHPSYHGEIAVDPETGAILRLTLQTDIPPGHPIYRADVLVEYGPVEIGGQQYLCPAKSVSIAQTMDSVTTKNASCSGNSNCTPAEVVHPNDISLNDTVYHSYHIFRAEMRILPEDPTEVEDSTKPASPATAAPEH